MAYIGCPFILSWFFVFYFCLIIFFLQLSFEPHHDLHQKHTINFKANPNLDTRIGRGVTININHCSDIGYRSKAFIRKDMLETYFPGVDVILSIQPPNLQRRVLVRIIHLGGVMIIAFGEHVLQRMGIPRHVFVGMLIGNPSLWSLGKAVVTVLEETEAFEVYVNGELIFSKLKEDRFPTEFELRELVARKIVDSTVEDGLGAGILWS